MATNKLYELGIQLPFTGLTGAKSNDPVVIGSISGVALFDADASGNTSVDMLGVYNLSVKGIDDNGNHAISIGDPIFVVPSDTPKLSAKVSGTLFGYAYSAGVGSGSTATIGVMLAFHIAPGVQASPGTVGTTQLATSGVTAAKLSATLKTGTIKLDLFSARALATNATQNAAAIGGLLASDTTPILQRVNGATDIAARLNWAATVVTEVQFAPVHLPYDLDVTQPVLVKLAIAKDANTDTAAVVAVKAFQGVGGSNLGGNTAALAAATLAVKSVSLTVSANEVPLAIALVPGAHADDAVYLYDAWLEYTRV
jgi:Uncharacterized conserved protein (DUF2190)